MARELDPLYDLQVTCQLCATAYSTKKVRSRFSYAYQTDSDFCPYYKTEYNPLYYFVHVCPECGYAQTKQFSEITSLEMKQKLIEEVSSKWEKKDFGQKRNFEQGITALKLGLLSANLKKERHSVLAGLCLRLAWLYRTKGMVKEEERFLSLAVKEYEEAYQQSDFEDSSMSEIRLIYLIGELHRRLKQFNSAIRFFSMAIDHKHKNLETGIVRLAREQWQLAREEYKELQN